MRIAELEKQVHKLLGELGEKDAELAALRRFVEWARASAWRWGDAVIENRVAELEAELAKAAGGGGTEG